MIRTAVPADVLSLVALFKAHHAAMRCQWPFDPAVLSMTLAQAIDKPDWLCLTGDRCLFLAACYDSPLGAGKIASELCFCVGGETLEQIVACFEAWARERGCGVMSLACEQRFPAFARLYGRLGYRVSEMTASKTI